MKDEPPIIEFSWWRLQGDVAWGRALLSIATMYQGAEVRSDIYLFLGDRYWRLARRHFIDGRQKYAERLVRKARFYFRAGGGAEPPPLAVGSLPMPEVPSLISAIGGGRGSGEGNDAA